MSRIAAAAMLALVSWPACGCEIEQVVGEVYGNAIMRAAELAKQQTGLLHKFRTITNRAKDSNKPLNQQLSQADLAEFTQTQTRFQSIELLQMLESNYARDIRVVRDFFKVAQADYLGTPAPKEGEKNYVPYAFLMIMGAIAEDKSIQNDLITVPKTPGCNLEMALHAVEQESFDKIAKLPMGQANKDINAIAARNKKGGKIDPDELNAADRALYDKIQRTAYVPAQREKAFITNLESLKLIARVATMKYELGKKDAIDSGGDIDAVGKSVQALNLDDRTKIGFGMLDKIAEKYPSDWMIQKQQMAPAIDAIKKEDAARMSKKK